MIKGLKESDRKYFEGALLEQLQGQETTDSIWGSSSCNDEGIILEGEKQELKEFLKPFMQLLEITIQQDAGAYKIVTKKAAAPSKEAVDEFTDAVKRLFNQNKHDEKVAKLYVELKKLQEDNHDKQALLAVRTGDWKKDPSAMHGLTNHIFRVKAKTLSQRAINMGALCSADRIKVIARDAIEKQQQNRRAIFDSFNEREVEVLDSHKNSAA
jgi:hypothetical protein